MTCSFQPRRQLYLCSNGALMLKINFCHQCGEPTSSLQPEGEDRLRDVCTSCGFIQYLNPRVVVGTLPMCGSKVLLCKRAIEPRRGYWTLPAGYLECGETAQQGARRESLEEAGITLAELSLYAVYDIPHINQMYLFYRGLMSSAEFSAGHESLEVALFEEDEIPWDDIAFQAIGHLLRTYFEHRKTGEYPLVEHNFPTPEQ